MHVFPYHFIFVTNFANFRDKNKKTGNSSKSFATFCHSLPFDLSKYQVCYRELYKSKELPALREVSKQILQDLHSGTLDEYIEET